MDSSRWGRSTWSLALGAILLLSLWLRWPQPPPAWSHFDEESLVLLPLGFWGGDLNPHFFNYPTFHFYLLSLLYFIYFLVSASGPVEQFVAFRFFVDGSDLLSIARAVGTLMSVGTVAVTAFLARQLYGRAAGLAAALILALMPLSVRFAHLANTDTAAVLWVALALMLAVRVGRRGNLPDYLLAGLFVGLAGATKYPAVLCAVPVAVAALLRKPTFKQAGLWCSGGVAILVFSVTSPFVLLDSTAFWVSFSEMGRDHLMAASRGYGPSWLYHLQHTFRYGLGLAGTVFLLAALVWKPAKWRHEEIILASGIAAFAAVLVVAESVFMRYALPLTPVIAVLTARLIGLHHNRIALLLGLAVLSAEPAYTSLKTRALLSGADTREQAADWLAQHSSGRRLVHLPRGCGNIQVLTPDRALIRQTHFQRSYDDQRLIEAYAWLSEEAELPPLYVDRAFARPPIVDHSSGKSTTQQSANQPVVLLQYDHPVCPPQTDSLTMERLDPSSGWVAASFSPGPLEAPVFDEMDWFFVPIGGFAGAELSGPTIQLGTVALSSTNTHPASAEDFFELLGLTHQGRTAMVRRDWETAIRTYQTVLQTPVELAELLPADHLHQLYSNVGLAYVRAGRFGEAIEPLRRATTINPYKYEAYDDIAVAHANLGQSEQAIAAWEKVVELQPRHGVAFFNLAKVLFNSGQVERAYAVALKGLELTPNHPMAPSVRRFVERGLHIGAGTP